MKVLFINTVYKKGSTGRIIFDLGKTLEENGHEYMVAFGRGKDSDPHCYRIGTDPDVYIHAGLSRITDRTGFYSKAATKKLIKFIDEYSPDVIHLHNLHGYYINIKVLFTYLAEQYKGKVIWTLHDCWAFTGHCVHFTYAKCDKWKKQCIKCPEKKRYPCSFVTDASKSNYNRKKLIFNLPENMVIVTPSEWLKNMVKQSFLKKYKCCVINNGIDLSLFPEKEADNGDQKILLSVMDGLDERKGYKDLERIADKLGDEYKTVIVGLKKKEIRSVSEKVMGICRTESIKEIVDLYQKADYFINTTYEDTFPTVNIESLACGTPVITYNSGGSPEIIDDKCGYVVNPGKIDEIVEIIKNNKRPDSRECRKRAESFDIKVKNRDYLDLYNTVLKEKNT